MDEKSCDRKRKENDFVDICVITRLKAVMQVNEWSFLKLASHIFYNFGNVLFSSH